MCGAILRQVGFFGKGMVNGVWAREVKPPGGCHHVTSAVTAQLPNCVTLMTLLLTRIDPVRSPLVWAETVNDTR